MSQPGTHSTARKVRQWKAALNLAKGLSPEHALVEAGYSESYARSHAYRVIKRPYVQSMLTEAIERVMKANNKHFDAIVEPYVKALDALLIMKYKRSGDAKIVKDPETGVPLPDHATRMNAADRLTRLFGAELKMPEEDDCTAPKRIFIREWVTDEVHHHGHHLASGAVVPDSQSGDGRGGLQPTLERADQHGREAKGAASSGVESVATACAGGEWVVSDATVPQAVTADASSPGLSRRVVRRELLPNLQGSERAESDDL